jgi:hypothetical protein
MTKTQKAKLAALTANSAKCRVAALDAGVSRSALLASIFAALGATPELEPYNMVQLDTQIGYTAAYLRRKGDNKPDAELLNECHLLLTKYQGATGTTPVRTGMLGRRNALQEAAYGSARQLWKRDVKEAGVTAPQKSGTNSGTTKKAPAKATAKGNAKGKEDGPQASPKLTSEAASIKWAERQAAFMLATMNKSGKAPPAWLKSICAEFKAQVDAREANSHPFVASKK